MPLIERICECGNRWEDLVGMLSAPPAVECPSCGVPSTKTALGSFASVTVCGIEKMTPGEIQLGFENKRMIESRADDIHSGAIRIKEKSTVPAEMRPVIPKTIY